MDDAVSQLIFLAEKHSVLHPMRRSLPLPLSRVPRTVLEFNDGGFGESFYSESGIAQLIKNYEPARGMGWADLVHLIEASEFGS